jgi:hypothetical protein
MIAWWMNDQVQKVWEEAAVEQSRFEPAILRGVLRKATKYPDRLAGVRTDILT